MFEDPLHIQSFVSRKPIKFKMLLPDFTIFVLIFLISITKHTAVLCERSTDTDTIVEKNFLRSYYSLTVLAATEQDIYATLSEYWSALNEIPAILEWYFDDYADSCKLVTIAKSTSWETLRENVIAGHPLLAYRTLYRYLLHIWPIIDEFKLVSGLNDTLVALLTKIQGSVGWPKLADVQDAMKGILRLQHVYDLNITQFVITDTSSSFVQAMHCYELGNFAVEDRHFALAVEWLEFAKFLVQKRGDSTIDLETIEKSLAAAKQTHDLEWERVPSSEPEFFTFKLETIANRTNLRQKRRTYHAAYWKGKRESNFNTINFWGLCSGEDMRTEEEKMELFCWYDSNSNPAWRINPIKIEQLGKTPIVIQIYEVLPNHLIKKLISESQPDLMKSQVYADSSSTGRLSMTRTSLNTWLEDATDVELMVVSRRIELITGLVVLPDSSSETIQIASYTFGEHYEVHQDVFKDDNEYFTIWKGERIATFMIYLSDVEKGGYTAFPQAGIAAQPLKGSAVFWYNTKRNGQADENTWHGACPVLQGQKWVANKWIRTYDQFLTRPCSLDPEE